MDTRSAARARGARGNPPKGPMPHPDDPHRFRLTLIAEIPTELVAAKGAKQAVRDALTAAGISGEIEYVGVPHPFDALPEVEGS